jgi:hypothetical protein|tara:strand:- start:1834 stop:2070 length:237 start_codon:yes stop_codon:yes gene_type:complete
MATITRKRARSTGGKFRGDDPSTPDINEAWEETTVATKKAPAKKAAAKKTAAPKAKAGLPHPASAEYKAMILRGEIKE